MLNSGASLPILHSKFWEIHQFFKKSLIVILIIDNSSHF